MSFDKIVMVADVRLDEIVKKFALRHLHWYAMNDAMVYLIG